MSIQNQGEIIIKGLTGSEGVVIGSVLVVEEKKRRVQPSKITSRSVSSHLARFTKAKSLFLEELEELSSNLDSKTAEILETQKHIISDQDIDQRVVTAIKEELLSVDFAIFMVFNEFIERLRESGSELFQQRIIDLENLRDHLIDLSVEKEKKIAVEKGSILVAREISPTDLVAYHEKGVLGLVLDRGGVTSHAAIIAQSLNIPCIVSSKNALKNALDSKKAILDANSGELILNPTREKLGEFKKKIRELNRLHKAQLKSKERSETSDGFPFHLRANIEFEQELDIAKQNGAEGIGLLRTEALLYGGIAKKEESEQDRFYNAILEGSSGQVVIRLFDVGGDKLNISSTIEDNPFLGWRGIRMLLDEKEMFSSQLRSILRCAGKYPGRIRILVPMISVVEEIIEVRATIEKIQYSLIEEGIPVDETVPLGVMIEVPSAALIAHHLAKEVDFFSIGTNDLTQYTLAVDRGNEKICSLYQQHHPAVWHLIKLSVDAAKENEIEIGVCGELAGDDIGAACLVGLGVTDLSMSPGSIPKVKQMLNNRSKLELEKFSESVLSCSTTSEVLSLYETWG